VANKKSRIERRLDSIDRKISKIQKEEKNIESGENKIGNKIKGLAKGEKNLERTIVKLGKVELKRSHIFELIRASAGAFLGVGIGRGLIGLDSVAVNLHWGNVLGILIFILGISALLIYKDGQAEIKSKGKAILIQRLFFIYLVSITIELVSLILFNVQYDSLQTLLKIIIVGSYTAMASAITFSLAK